MTTVNSHDCEQLPREAVIIPRPIAAVEGDEGGGGVGPRGAPGDSSPLRCTQCSDTFQDVMSLLSHIDSHAFSCPVCQKDFTTKSFLERHMASHTEESHKAGVTNGEVQKQAGEAQEEAQGPGKDLESGEVQEKGEESGKDRESGKDPQDVVVPQDTPMLGDLEESLEARETGEAQQEEPQEAGGNADSEDNNIENQEGNQGDESERIETQLDEDDEQKDVTKIAAVAEVDDKPTEGQTEVKTTNDQSAPTNTKDLKQPEKAGSVTKDEPNNNNGDEKCGSEERDMKSNCSVTSEESQKSKTDKPYKCSKCKYAAKCVASVHIHQRRNHPGEWTTVISTLPETEAKPEQQEEEKHTSEDEEDEEVRRALHTPLLESESEEETGREFRCSMCTFSAKDTETVFEHQRIEHPGEWQLNDTEMGNLETGSVNTNKEDDDEEEEEETLYHLPTDLDQYSVMGRSIIAGTTPAALNEQRGSSSGQSSSSRVSFPGNQLQYWQGYNRLTGRFHCPNCPAFFYEANQHTRHIKMCMKNLPSAPQAGQYRCLLCKRVFPDMEALRPHMTSHQRYFRAFRCSCCGYNAKFEGTIMAHIRQRHPADAGASIERIAEPADIQNIPNKWEKIMKSSGIEAEEVTNDPDLQKLFGGVSQYFPNSASIGLDLADEDSSSSSLLDADTQGSDNSDELTPEMLQSLRVGNNYVCPECPVLFREPNKLRRHLDIHGGIKRHTCNICNKRFTRSEHLKRHRFVHATTKPYMCSICYYSSKRLDNLQKHQKVKHPGENYSVIRVSKEMIEAEIAANNDTQSPQPPPPAPLPAAPSASIQTKTSLLPEQIKIVMPATPSRPYPYIISQPSSRPKRGRPRKISSPDEMFVFSRDPELVGTNTTTITSSVSGNTADQNLLSMIQLQQHQQQQPIQHMMTQGGILSITNPAGLTSGQPLPITSTQLLTQGFDLSSITAVAAAAAKATTSTPITIAPVPEKSPENDQSFTSIIASSSQSELCDPGSPKASSGLVNRGKYQCHVCDRPFSYLKPFKKHLLCHGTFMPYQCSACGHQTKRRDMMQDHQRENHPGINCDIQVMEPTADMHDMMDTYIQQQPASPPSSLNSSTSISNLNSNYDERMVDPQIDMQALGLNLQVKTEIMVPEEPLHTSTPEKDEVAPSMSESSRSTSSPSVLSSATVTSSPSMVRPRARRLIKFKVLSSHTRVPRPILPKPDLISPTVEVRVKEEKDTGDDPLAMTEKTSGQTPAIKRAATEDPGTLTPSKIRRTSGEEVKLECDSPTNSEESESIGTAPRMSIMGLRPRQKLVTPKHYDLGFQLTKDRKASEIVVDLKSNKGTPKAKQGDNHRFACSVCEQRFAYEKPFKRHLLVHGGFEPYRCNVCGHQTTSRDTMKIHQNKSHPSVRNAGITVLDPTPEMEQSLIKQGLLQPSQPVSDEEESFTSKSIVEAARIEQHMMANAMKTLSNTVKGKGMEEGKDDQSMPSFHSLLGLKPKTEETEEEEGGGDGRKTSGGKKVEGKQEEDECSEVQDEAVIDNDDMSDMPVDEVLFANSESGSSVVMEASCAEYECEYCGKTFQCPTKLQRHVATHTGTKAYECQICFKKLTRLEHLKRHLLTHGNLKPYKCSNCNFDAKRLDIVQLHQQTMHAGEPVGIEYLFTPSIMTPDSRGHRQQAEPSTRSDKPADLACSLCGTRFREMANLVQHQKLHATGQKPYECYICHKTFTRPEHLKRHRLVHDDTKPYRCSECGFKTKRLDGMREHQRSRHPASKVFIIDTILADNPSVKRKRGRPPKFGARDSLEGLQLMHCDKCCLAFYDQGRFEQHKLSHIPSPSKSMELTCHLCGVRVSQAKHLRRHMLLHQDHYPYQCSHCFYTTKRTDHMKLHFRKSHPEETPQIIYVAKDHSASTSQPLSLEQDEEAFKAYLSSAECLLECQSDSTGHSSSLDQSYLTDHSDLYAEGSYLDGSIHDTGSNMDELSNAGGSNCGDVREEGEGEEMAREGATAFCEKLTALKPHGDGSSSDIANQPNAQQTEAKMEIDTSGVQSSEDKAGESSVKEESLELEAEGE